MKGSVYLCVLHKPPLVLLKYSRVSFNLICEVNLKIIRKYETSINHQAPTLQNLFASQFNSPLHYRLLTTSNSPQYETNCQSTA